MKKLTLIFLFAVSPLLALELNRTISPFDTTGLKQYINALDSTIAELQKLAAAIADLQKQPNNLAALGNAYQEEAKSLKRKKTLILGLIKAKRQAK